MEPIPRSRSMQQLPRYVEMPPSPELAPWVACYWAIRAEDAPLVPNRVLPDGCADFIVGIQNDPTPVVVGTMQRAVVIPTAGRVDLFGIRFRPGSALRLVGTPLSDLTDQRIPLEALWGRDADLMADMSGATSLAERAIHAERVLRRRLATGSRRSQGDEAMVAQAVGLLRRARGLVRISQVAAALGVGQRRLERAFVRSVGLSPKALGRVLRFRRALQEIAQALDGGRQECWAALAIAAGYADQSHLIREFQALAGLTPARYLAERRRVGFVQYPDGGAAVDSIQSSCD
jgi:methylphosphotriester-DNA--protein-cysteine methyltransferase